MKLSIAISWQDTDFGAIAKGSARELIGHAKDSGYDAVELAVRDPKLAEVAEVLAALNGMPVSAIGTGQAFLADGLSLSHRKPRSSRGCGGTAIRSLSPRGDLHCPTVIVGLMRGISGSADDLIASLKRVCVFAQSVGIRIVVEPINRYETRMINTAAQGIDLIEKVGADNLGLLLDTFHMNIEEANPAASLVFSNKRLWHVHLADSNRHAPGSGHIDFQGIVATLRALNYRGYLSAEIMPCPDAVTAMDAGA